MIGNDFYDTVCNYIVPQCNLWTFDGWNLAEFVIIYCLERNKEIPLLNANFFDDCLRYVSGGKLNNGERKNALLDEAFPEFDKQTNYAQNLNKRDPNLRRGLSQAIEYIRDSMIRHTELMLQNFPIRYNKWIKLKAKKGLFSRVFNLKNNFLII